MSLHYSLAKVIFRLKFGKKLSRYMLCGGVAACHRYGVCTVWWVWQRVIGLVCVLCGGVAACHRYGVCTVRWCGSMS